MFPLRSCSLLSPTESSSTHPSGDGGEDERKSRAREPAYNKARLQANPRPTTLTTRHFLVVNSMDGMRRRITWHNADSDGRPSQKPCWTEPVPTQLSSSPQFSGGDRTAASGECQGGRVCINVNNDRCTDTSCSLEIECLALLCRPLFME